jgi:hypothetical protein
MPYHNSSKGIKAKGGRKHNASSKRTYKKKSKTNKNKSKNAMKIARKTARKRLPDFSKMKGYSEKQLRELRKLSAL